MLDGICLEVLGVKHMDGDMKQLLFCMALTFVWAIWIFTWIIQDMLLYGQVLHSAGMVRQGQQMKIKHVNWRGNLIEFTIKEAIEDATTPDAYSYDGQLERLQSEIEKLRELVARLVEQLPLTKDQLKAILGYGYEVEE